MAVLKAVVTPQLGEIAGYGLIFGLGPILRYIGLRYLEWFLVQFINTDTIVYRYR